MAAGAGDVYNESAKRAFVYSLLNVLAAGNKIELIPNQDGTEITIENTIYDYIKSMRISQSDTLDSLRVDFVAVIGNVETPISFRAALPNTLMGKPNRVPKMLNATDDFDFSTGVYELPIGAPDASDNLAVSINLSAVFCRDSDIGKTFTFIRRSGGSSTLLLCSLSRSDVKVYIKLRCLATITLQVVENWNGQAVFAVVGTSSFPHTWKRINQQNTDNWSLDILAPCDPLSYEDVSGHHRIVGNGLELKSGKAQLHIGAFMTTLDLTGLEAE